MKTKSITVLGAGAWGTALAVQAHNAGNRVTLWAYLEEEKQSIETHGENKMRLPGVHVPSDIGVSTNLGCVAGCDYVLVVTPAQTIRSFLADLKPHLSPSTKVIFCSKGIEIATGNLLSEIAHDTIPENDIGFFSGPNFAKEIAQGAPGASSIAFRDLKVAQEFSACFSTQVLRVYPTDDTTGVEIGGAYKNVVAIAAGILKGAGYGENALAALVTRGLAEMNRFALHQGAKSVTAMSLSGVGDLMLCCYSTTSRNMKLGFDIGQGTHKKQGDEAPLTEGAHTVKALYKIAQSQGLDLPICQVVHDILFADLSIADAESRLLDRPLPSHELQPHRSV